jgi:hypothetical protein
MKKLSAIIVIIGVMVLGISGLAMANLITNGNFDSGLAGWTTSGDVDLGNGGTNPLSGNYALLGSDITSGTSYISQSFFIPFNVERLAISFSYRFVGIDLGTDTDTALANLRQYILGVPIATNELLTLTSSFPGDWSQGTYYGEVNVADWWIFDATSGNLRFTLNEGSSIWTNYAFSVDNVNVESVPEPTTMLLLGLGLVGLAGFRRKK